MILFSTVVASHLVTFEFDMVFAETSADKLNSLSLAVDGLMGFKHRCYGSYKHLDTIHQSIRGITEYYTDGA